MAAAQPVVSELRVTDGQTDRQTKYCNPRCACAPRVNEGTRKTQITIFGKHIKRSLMGMLQQHWPRRSLQIYSTFKGISAYYTESRHCMGHQKLQSSSAHAYKLASSSAHQREERDAQNLRHPLQAPSFTVKMSDSPNRVVEGLIRSFRKLVDRVDPHDLVRELVQRRILPLSHLEQQICERRDRAMMRLLGRVYRPSMVDYSTYADFVNALESINTSDPGHRYEDIIQELRIDASRADSPETHLCYRSVGSRDAFSTARGESPNGPSSQIHCCPTW